MKFFTFYYLFFLVNGVTTSCDVVEVYQSTSLSEISGDARILTNGELVSDALILVPTQLDVDVYTLSVSKKADNLYKVDYKDIYLKTNYCYEYSSYQEIILKWESNLGYTKGKLIFDD